MDDDVAKGCFVSAVLVLPFWIAVVYIIWRVFLWR